MPETKLYVRVKQALNWLKRNKGILQKDIADKIGMAESSFTRALARCKETEDNDFVILFHSAVNKYISLDYLLTGEGELTIQTDQAFDKMEQALTHGGAVEIVQMAGDGAQVRVFFRATEEHGGDEGVHGRFLIRHGPHQLEAQGSLLEPAVIKAAQRHAVCQNLSLDHGVLLCKLQFIGQLSMMDRRGRVSRPATWQLRIRRK